MEYSNLCMCMSGISGRSIETLSMCVQRCRIYVLLLRLFGCSVDAERIKKTTNSDGIFLKWNELLKWVSSIFIKTAHIYRSLALERSYFQMYDDYANDIFRMRLEIVVVVIFHGWCYIFHFISISSSWSSISISGGVPCYDDPCKRPTRNQKKWKKKN